MKTIALELSVFLIALVVVIFAFSFFVAWKVASLDLRTKKAEKDLNNLGDSMRANRGLLISRLTRQEIKFNELVEELDLPTKFKNRPPSEN